MIVNKGSEGIYLINLTTWITHVLMTKSGFAMNIHQKYQVTERKFIPWYEIKYLNPVGIYWGLRSKRLEFIRDPNFETKNGFKNRKWEFPLKFIPIAIESRKNRIAEMEANPTKFKSRFIRKMKRRIYGLDIELDKYRKKANRKMTKMDKNK